MHIFANTKAPPSNGFSANKKRAQTFRTRNNERHTTPQGDLSHH
jgi:hypothetical protein